MRQVRTEGGIVVGNAYDKLRTRNPIAWVLVRSFMASFDALVAQTGAQKVHEVGCGEGNLAARLRAKGLVVRGSVLSVHVAVQLDRAHIWRRSRNARRRCGRDHMGAEGYKTVKPESYGQKPGGAAPYRSVDKIALQGKFE